MAKMTIKEARSLLGEKYKKISDEEVQQIIDELDVLANICIDSYLEQKRKSIPFSPRRKRV